MVWIKAMELIPIGEPRISVIFINDNNRSSNLENTKYSKQLTAMIGLMYYGSKPDTGVVMHRKLYWRYNHDLD